MVNLLKINGLINYTFRLKNGQKRSKSCKKERVNFWESKLMQGRKEL